MRLPRGERTCQPACRSACILMFPRTCVQVARDVKQAGGGYASVTVGDDVGALAMSMETATRGWGRGRGTRDESWEGSIIREA